MASYSRDYGVSDGLGGDDICPDKHYEYFLDDEYDAGDTHGWRNWNVVCCFLGRSGGAGTTTYVNVSNYPCVYR